MKQLVFLLISLLASSQSFAQTDTTGALARLDSCARTMCTFFNQRDYDHFAEYVHPNLVDVMGGKQKMVEILKSSSGKLASDKSSSQHVSTKPVLQLIAAGNELQAVVPQELEVKDRKRRMVTTSYLLATSGDGGRTWHFLDIGAASKDQVMQVVPTMSDKLIIPEKESPVISKIRN